MRKLTVEHCVVRGGSGSRLAMRIFSVIAMAVTFVLLIGCSLIQSQRLCENNDNPVATISPCQGPTGTTITVTPDRQLSSAPGTLVFKRVVANGVPAQVITQISGNTVSSPPQLCMVENGRWEVWLSLANGEAQGKIGAFWTTGCVGGTSTGLGIDRGPTNAPSPNELIILPPITINVDNEVYVKTKNTSQSYIKDIGSTVPEVATGTEWGTNDVKIRGKSPGITTISFFDANTGTLYRIQVTVVKKGDQPGGDGAAKSNPIDVSCQLDSCLAGTWRSISGEVGPRTGGSGIALIIKPNCETTADYSSMQDLTDGTYYIKHFGNGSAFIRTDGNLLTIVREGPSTVRFESTNPGGRVGKGNITALGPILDPSGKTVNFTCGTNRLVFEAGGTFSKYTFEKVQ